MTNLEGEPLADGEPSGRTGTGRDRKHLPLWQETGLLLAIAVVLAVLIKAFLVQAFYIPSESMEPGLVRNDRIMVQKVSYWGSATPQRGDVVVFKDPGGWLSAADNAGPQSTVTKVMAKIGLYPTGGHLVKRVIGVAGDVIECCDDQGRISVNGMPLNEGGYIRPADCNGPMPTGPQHCNWTAGPIPEGQLFVMGDNRGSSADSSWHLCNPDADGCVPGDAYVPTDLVVGKVFVLLWPRDHFRWIGRPNSFSDVPPDPE